MQIIKSTSAQTNTAPQLCLVFLLYLIELPKDSLFSQTLSVSPHPAVKKKLQEPIFLHKMKPLKENIFSNVNSPVLHIQLGMQLDLFGVVGAVVT